MDATLHEILQAERRLIDERFLLERRVIEQKFASLADALVLQREEYHRRLDLLNNHAERIEGILAQTVPREVFGIHAAAWEHWKRDEWQPTRDEVLAIKTKLVTWVGVFATIMLIMDLMLRVWLR